MLYWLVAAAALVVAAVAAFFCRGTHAAGPVGIAVVVATGVLLLPVVCMIGSSYSATDSHTTASCQTLLGLEIPALDLGSDVVGLPTWILVSLVYVVPTLWPGRGSRPSETLDH